ncbi:scavenger receptor class F member 1-like [Crassostrea angulata]|uniref:scavenger receptor class F member 1-like n=1 Tax=Magallana angulata TaxID=2784310 RepID=UPI0022B14F37|nr:scavenger receptor class F member 1-like [Crassostrea angulata]
MHSLSLNISFFCLMIAIMRLSVELRSTKEIQATAKPSNVVSCLPGRIGENCSIPCRYPSYGSKCQKECICGESQCSPVTGCMESSVTLFTIPVSSRVIVTSPFRTSKSCPIGYMGNDCKQQCRFPNYGKECQSFCKCTSDFCDHIDGCNISEIENNSKFECDKPCLFEDHGIYCHLNCTCSQHMWNNLTGCTISNFEDRGLLSTINFYNLRTAVIILGVIAIVFSLTYACTYLRTCDGQHDSQSPLVNLVINRDPIYANIIV